ncbi:Crp/Fnr family transcriptional regulator [Acetobacteraceae bacterium ESL0709]|nr:Crp/Fnr family transcriptional regulator [Acetobacteraceae bacterium ESL0697]MDF7678985.1 Crp/Fnr family transcriptional regulator [Acetobacteraceae bacterium ESL0709]
MLRTDGISFGECSVCCGRSRSICNAIDEKDLPVLLAESSRLHLSSGRIFIEESEPAVAFYVIAEGQAKLFNLLPDGRRQITGFAMTGDFLGLAASERYAFSAESLGEIRLCRFAYENMDRLTERFPQLQKRLRMEASRELVKVQGRLILLGRKSARERLASFFMEQAESAQIVSGKFCPLTEAEGAGNQTDSSGITLYLPMSRTDVADYLGLTIETVSRTLKIFKDEGLIRVEDVKSITVLNSARMAHIAEGNG